MIFVHANINFLKFNLNKILDIVEIKSKFKHQS